MNDTKLLHHLTRTWADRAPASIVLEINNRSCTYLELEQASNRVARALLEAGLRPGERVGIYASKSIETVISMLGALKAGGVYVPLDPTGPAGRARLCMQDCLLRRLITTPPLLISLANEAGSLALLDQVILIGNWTGDKIKARGAVTTWSEIETLSDHPVGEQDRDENDLAYILYTSGSTGAPKGVAISHRNALAFVEWAGEEFQVAQTDRLSNHAPFHFDLSVFDLYAAFRSGARVILIDEATARRPRDLAQLISEKAVTIWYSVPSVLKLMLDHGGLESEKIENLRVILFAGEVFPIKYLHRLMRAVPAAAYYNLYGPTETNVCTYYQVKHTDLSRQEPVPIGRACSGDRVYVLDEHGHEIEGQEPGELWVEGPTVMQGYWSKGKIAERSARYGTGDIVSRDSEGQLIYHGRKDGMLKVKGFRVEIGEVEAALWSHPGIVDAMVVPLKDVNENTYLLAAVVGRDEALSVLDVKRHCAKLLPSYMVPQVVKFFPHLPRTGTDKLDRVGLIQAVTSQGN